ncbi:hypothetical protein C7M84_002874 [Penaeus vannamei]|uniref:Uncharacterized protein n=1 Tax=Penaeus vannamei TaxID=6689 RepID=A0A3R7MBQ7_PENVA|nr:hypothetical protein C7M84_014732 [Penaeus vannamei]ROT78396.1 hypothetical protein C7M84_002874 [Penaeus vannamei]
MINDEVDEPCVCPAPERNGLPEAMYWAARNGDTDKVKSWLEGGGDVNAADHEGDTMLRGACRGGQTAVLMILLKNEDLHLNVRDSDGRTPLMKAARRGHDTTVRMMCAAKLKCKLDYTAQDNKGNTASSLALQNSFKESTNPEFLKRRSRNRDNVGEHKSASPGHGIAARNRSS